MGQARHEASGTAPAMCLNIRSAVEEAKRENKKYEINCFRQVSEDIVFDIKNASQITQSQYEFYGSRPITAMTNSGEIFTGWTKYV